MFPLVFLLHVKLCFSANEWINESMHYSGMSCLEKHADW
jgi:hypothetical protein